MSRFIRLLQVNRPGEAFYIAPRGAASVHPGLDHDGEPTSFVAIIGTSDPVRVYGSAEDVVRQLNAREPAPWET